MSLFGSDNGDKKRQEQYNKLSSYDNRMNDFKTLSGTALNDLSNRGVLNSSVTSKAMGQALSEAEKNFWNDQMQLLTYYDYDKDNSTGSFAPFMQGIGSAGGAILGGYFGGPTGAQIGSAAGGAFGGTLGSGISSFFR